MKSIKILSLLLVITFLLIGTHSAQASSGVTSRFNNLVAALRRLYTPASQLSAAAASIDIHPSDISADARIDLTEMQNYSVAWKTGATWPTSPSPVSLDYMSSSAFLWKSGETYHYDSTQACPTCYVTGAGTVTPPSTWTKNISGSGTVSVTSSANDSSGNTIVAGQFSGTVSVGGISLISGGGQDIFLAKYTSAGTVVWAKRYGNVANEIINSIVLDTQGNIYAGGTYAFAPTADFGGGLVNNLGGFDAFIAKYSSAGDYVWAKTFGGASNDNIAGIALDATGQNIIVAGQYNGTIQFNLDPLATLTSTTGDDSLLLKYAASNGSLVWKKTFNNRNTDGATGVAVDSGDNIYLTGFFDFMIDLGPGPLTVYGYGSGTINPSRDIYMAKFAPSGTVAPGSALWEKAYGGPGQDQIGQAALDANNNLVIFGTFGYPLTISLGGSTFQGTPTSIGSVDLFLAKYSGADGSHIWSNGFLGKDQSTANALDIDTQGNILIGGSFKVERTFGSLTMASVKNSFGIFTNDGFFAKYTSGGTYVKALQVAGSSDDLLRSITVDSSNYPVLGGYFGGTINLGGIPFTSQAPYDGFLMKVNP